MRKNFLLFYITLLLLVQSKIAYSQTVFSSHLAHTYSIVARDPETKEMGVAVQSHESISGV